MITELPRCPGKVESLRSPTPSANTFDDVPNRTTSSGTDHRNLGALAESRHIRPSSVRSSSSTAAPLSTRSARTQPSQAARVSDTLVTPVNTNAQEAGRRACRRSTSLRRRGGGEQWWRCDGTACEKQKGCKSRVDVSELAEAYEPSLRSAGSTAAPDGGCQAYRAGRADVKVIPTGRHAVEDQPMRDRAVEARPSHGATCVVAHRVHG